MAAYGSGAVARSIRDKADGDERRRRRRHLEDRDLRRRQGGRRSPPSMSARGSSASMRDGTHRAARGGRPALRRRARASRSKLGDTLAPTSGARARRAHGGSAVRGHAGRRRRRAAARPAAARSADRIAARSTQVTFSGGVSEYIYGREAETLRRSRRAAGAAKSAARVEAWGPKLERRERGHPRHRHRRLAIHHAGERQHDLRRRRSKRLPLRNVPVIAPALRARRRDDRLRRGGRARSQGVLRRLDLDERRHAGRGVRAVAAARRRSSGSTPSAAASSRGLRRCSARGHPLVLAGDGDVGGLLGIHLREEMKLDEPDRLDRRPRAQGIRLHRHRRRCWRPPAPCRW